jgi:hypothetical protein
LKALPLRSSSAVDALAPAPTLSGIANTGSAVSSTSWTRRMTLLRAFTAWRSSLIVWDRGSMTNCIKKFWPALGRPDGSAQLSSVTGSGSR